MPRTTPRSRFADPLRRVMAAGCAALVFALTIFAASPLAHEWLHQDAHRDCQGHPHSKAPAPTEADSCAVVLFASGVSLPVGPVAVVPPRAAALSVSPVTAAEIYLVSPRYLRQPERGPPVSRVV